MTTAKENWHGANQRYFMAVLALVRRALEAQTARLQGASPPTAGAKKARKELSQAKAALPGPAALDVLCEMFHLSPFERDVTLMCAGMELDASFPSLCAAASGDPGRNYPTLSLALTVFPEPHWSALTPAAPLRHWRLIELGSGESLTVSTLRLDERILHYLTGIQHLDERLVGFVDAVEPVDELLSSQQELAERLVAAWSKGTPGCVLQLCGGDRADQLSIAAAACGMLGLQLCEISSQALPTAQGELDAWMRLWEREAALGGRALLLDCWSESGSDAARSNAMERLIEGTKGALVVASRERQYTRQRSMITFDVRKPNASEQRAIWKSALGDAAPALNGKVEALVSQFSLNVPDIRAVCARAAQSEANDLDNQLWDACRVQARPRLQGLAQSITPVATWDDLVLPEAQLRILREIGVHIRQRMKVYEMWGFAAKCSRGLGISALFAGASGTGKTMAAEVLANELRLDLYRIDLSSVVSKFIGETEKNLRRVFDAAEEGGAILLFDEADALFGKRSEVKDSHDRYANIEISYLLQRMETYRGLAVLTTNMKSALDSAFLRRLRFIAQFPFPDAPQRAEIWCRIFPTDTPTDGLDTAKLARLSVAGGNIRNIALYAAFLAAEEEAPVRMSHVLRAARVEYAKLEKSLTEAETVGWA